MMVRPKELERSVTIMITLEADIHEELISLQGGNKGNFSKWIRKKELEEVKRLRKKEEAQQIINPIGLPYFDKTLDDYVNILEYTDSVINNFAQQLEKVDDTDHLIRTKEKIQYSIIKRIDKHLETVKKRDKFHVNGKLIIRA